VGTTRQAGKAASRWTGNEVLVRARMIEAKRLEYNDELVKVGEGVGAVGCGCAPPPHPPPPPAPFCPIETPLQRGWKGRVTKRSGVLVR
jgi:hypothetical protein